MQIIQVTGLGSNLEGKEGLHAVGSIETIQAVGPDGASLSAEKKAFKMSFKSTYTRARTRTHTTHHLMPVSPE